MPIPDFIELYPDALLPQACAALVQRFDASGQDVAGTVGGGVMPDLKNSRDITLNGLAGWEDAVQQLNLAVFSGLLTYVRRYPYTLIAPLMVEHQEAGGATRRRLREADITAMNDAQLGRILMALLRPGDINLQRYKADQGGYPYWHCELYPKDRNCEPLHRHLLWTIYLNDGFEEGETEFMYQQRTIAPRTGSLLIAPTAFTHTHRGNMPKGGDKYIATSWVLFQRAETLFES